MTDAERLLEIATRLMAGILGNQTLRITSKPDGASDIEAIAACSFAAADALMKEWRERTGAREERGQDVSDELLEEVAHYISGDESYHVYEKILAIQRARAARDGELDVVGDALQSAYDAAMDHGEAAAVGSRLCQLIKDRQRARAAGKGE